MKYLYLIITFIICALNLSAQLLDHTLGQKPDGSALSVKGYTFPERIQSFSMDDSGAFICLNFRDLTSNGKYLKNKGKIGLYSLDKKRIIWKKSINYTLSHAI